MKSFIPTTGCLFALLMTTSLNAQMVDLMSSMGIQGALTNQGTKTVAQGMNALQQNQIVQELVQIATEAKITYMGNYSRISKSNFSADYLRNINWNIGAVGTSRFFIEMSSLDEQLCRKMVLNPARANEVLIDGQKASADQCRNGTTIRFIFD